MTIQRNDNGVVVTDGKTERVVQSLQGKQIPEGILRFRKQARTVAYYERHPGLIGTEMVGKLKAYTIRTTINGKLSDDSSYAPETGTCFIKQLSYNSDGSMVLVEAVKIEFR